MLNQFSTTSTMLLLVVKSQTHHLESRCTVSSSIQKDLIMWKTVRKNLHKITWCNYTARTWNDNLYTPGARTEMEEWRYWCRRRGKNALWRRTDSEPRGEQNQIPIPMEEWSNFSDALWRNHNIFSGQSAISQTSTEYMYTRVTGIIKYWSCRCRMCRF